MSDQPMPAMRRVRGRPRCEGGVRVTEQLLDAADRLLQQNSCLELTEKRIAAAAGVDEAMIRYYFGNKDGLLLDLTMRECGAMIEKLNRLDTLDLSSQAITRQIFSVICEAYYNKPWIARIMIPETTRRESMIRQHFVARFGTGGLVMAPLQRLIERLQQAGIYRRDVDAALTATSMISIVVAPLIRAPLAGEVDNRPAQTGNRALIAYAVDLFDAHLLAPVPARDAPQSAAAKCAIWSASAFTKDGRAVARAR